MSTDTGFIPATNDIIESVLSQASEPAAEPDAPALLLPVDTVFDLPGGYVSPVGEVGTDAEVRELTGRDEEAIAKAGSLSKVLQTTLQRGLVRVGEITAVDEIVLNNLLAGDRDYILMRIYAATFGPTVEVTRMCPECQSDKNITVDLLTHVAVKSLDNPNDRTFVVDCSVGKVKVNLPTGHAQKNLMSASDKTLSELSTILLGSTVVEIDGKPVFDRSSVLDLPIRDRRKINEEIAERNPGPQLQDTAVPCPSCETPLEVPLSVAALFQF